MGWKRQKLLKHTENSLEIVFMTKQQNEVFFWQFFHQTWAKTLKSTWNWTLLKNDFWEGKGDKSILLR